MNIIRRIRHRLFRWQQALLFRLITIKRIGAEPTECQIDQQQPIIYAMQTPSFAEQLVIDRVVSELDWGSPKQHGLEKQLSARHFFGIYRRSRLLFRKTTTPIVDRPLLSHVEWLRQHPERDIQIVPIRVFWGRAPEKEKSFMRIWLQNSGALGGRLVTLMAILFNGRNTFVHISPSLSLRDLMDDNTSNEVVARKVARVLRVQNRKVSTSVLGPDLSHRRTLIHNLPNKPMVLAAIDEEMQRTGISKAKAQKKALAYADEIASNISYTNVRFLDVLLTWVWNKLYDGITIHNIEPLKDVSKDNEIIYVPCHRSHIDYLLLSYVLYQKGLQMPQIAAGINLNMPVVGPILRRGGAFFMRRTFRDNKLYAAVFDEYLHSMFTQGYSTEYFVEGGRSRTGRTLNPKAGMLAMTLRSYLRDSRKPIIFMPVYTGYEKVFEANSYLGELRGQKKQKESLLGVLGSLRAFKRSFGKVNVTFGQPICLTEFLNQQQPDWRKQDYQPCDFRPQWAPRVVDRLALQVVTEINRAASINPINLIALSILSAPRQAMEASLLVTQMEAYQALLCQIPYSTITALPEGSGHDWLAHGESLAVVSRNPHPMGDLIQTDERQAVTLTYYRNNVLHLFALPSLIACLFVNNQRYTRDDVSRIVKQMYPYLQAELFLPWSTEQLDTYIPTWLTYFVEQGYLLENDKGFHAPPASSNHYAFLSGLANNVMQTLERYYLTIRLLKQGGSGCLKTCELEEKSTLLAQRLSLLYGINSPEFFDKALFRTLIQQLLQQQHATLDAQQCLTFDPALDTLLATLEAVLDGALRQSIVRSLHN